MKWLNKLIKCYKYYKNPRYMFVLQAQINDRGLFYLGAYPEEKNNYFYTYSNIDNRRTLKSKSHKRKIIWTFKDLLKYSRLLYKSNKGHLNTGVLEYKNKKWQNIKKENADD